MANKEAPEQFLADPQQLNTYSYGRNNPLVFVDPNGEKVEFASKRVFLLWRHNYFVVTPDYPNDSNLNLEGIPSGTTRFTLGGYNPDYNKPAVNRLIKDIGYENDSTPISTDFDANPVKSVVLTPPEGQNDTQFINNIVAAFHATPDNQNYYSFGNNPNLDGYSNSNNFVYQVAYNVGVGGQIEKFKGGPAPGQSVGLSVPNQPSTYQRTKSSIFKIKNSIKSFFKKLF